MFAKLKHFKHWNTIGLLVIAALLLSGAAVVKIHQSYADTLNVTYSTKKKNVTTNKTGKDMTYTVHVTGKMKNKNGQTVDVDKTFENINVRNGSTITIKAFSIEVVNKDSWTVQNGGSLASYGSYRHYYVTKGDKAYYPIYCCDPKRRAGIYKGSDYTVKEHDVTDLKSRTISWGFYEGCPPQQYEMYGLTPPTTNVDACTKIAGKELMDYPVIKEFIAATQIANWRRWNSYSYEDYKYYASYEKFTVSSKAWDIATKILKNADSNKTPPGGNDPVKGEVKTTSKTYKIKSADGTKMTTTIAVPTSVGSTYFTSTGWRFDSYFFMGRAKGETRMLPAMTIEHRPVGSTEWKTWYELPAVFNNFATTSEMEDVKGNVTIVINGSKKTFSGPGSYKKAYEEFAFEVLGDHHDGGDAYDNHISKQMERCALKDTDSSSKASGGSRMRVKFQWSDNSKLALFALGVTGTKGADGYYTSALTADEIKTQVQSSSGTGYKNIFAKLKQMSIKGGLIQATVTTRDAKDIVSSNEKQRYFYYKQKYADTDLDIPLAVNISTDTAVSKVYSNTSDLVISKYPMSSLRDHVDTGATNSSLQTYDSMITKGARAVDAAGNKQDHSAGAGETSAATVAGSKRSGKSADYQTAHQYTEVSQALTKDSDTYANSYAQLNFKSGLMSVYDSNYMTSVGSYAKLQTIMGGSNVAESQYYKAFQNSKYTFVPIGVGSGYKKIVNSAAEGGKAKGPLTTTTNGGSVVTGYDASGNAISTDTTGGTSNLLASMRSWVADATDDNISNIWDNADGFTLTTDGTASWVTADNRALVYGSGNTVPNKIYNSATEVKDTTIFKSLLASGVSRKSTQAYCKYLAKLYDLSIVNEYIKANPTLDIASVLQNNLKFAYDADSSAAVGAKAPGATDYVFDFSMYKDNGEIAAYKDTFTTKADGTVAAVTANAQTALYQDLDKFERVFLGTVMDQNSYTIYANYRSWVQSGKKYSERYLELSNTIDVTRVKFYLDKLDYGDFSNLPIQYAAEYYSNGVWTKATGNDYATRDGSYSYSYSGLGKRVKATDYTSSSRLPAIENKNGISYFFDKKLWLFNSQEANLIFELIKNDANSVTGAISLDTLSKAISTSNSQTYKCLSVGTQKRFYETNDNVYQTVASDLKKGSYGTLYTTGSLSLEKLKYCLLAAVYWHTYAGITNYTDYYRIPACSTAVKAYVCSTTGASAISGTNNYTATKVVDALYHMSQISLDNSVDKTVAKDGAGKNGSFTKAGINETVGTRVPSSIMTFFKAQFASNGEYGNNPAGIFANNCDRGGTFSAPINGLVWSFGYSANDSAEGYEYTAVPKDSLCHGYAAYQFASICNELAKQGGSTGGYGMNSFGPNGDYHYTDATNTGDEYVGSTFKPETTLEGWYNSWKAANNNNEDNVDKFLENCTSNIYYSVFKQYLDTKTSNHIVNSTYRIYPINIDALQMIPSINLCADVIAADSGASTTAHYWVNMEGKQCIRFRHYADWSPSIFFVNDTSAHYDSANNAGSGYVGSHLDSDRTVYDYNADGWYNNTVAWLKSAFGADGDAKVTKLLEETAAAGLEKTDEKVNIAAGCSYGDPKTEAEYEGSNYRCVTGYADRDTDEFMKKVTDSNKDDEDDLYFTVTTDKGSAYLDNLPAGDYYIVEVDTDTGYSIAESRAFLSQLHDTTTYSQAVNPLTQEGSGLADIISWNDIGNTVQKYGYQVNLTNLDIANGSDGDNLVDHYTRGFVYNATATKGSYGPEGSLIYKTGYNTSDSNNISPDKDDLITINDDNGDGAVSAGEEGAAAITDYWKYKTKLKANDADAVNEGINDGKYVRSNVIYWFNGYKSINQFNKFGVAYGGVRDKDVKKMVANNASYYPTYADDDNPVTLNKASTSDPDDVTDRNGYKYKETGTQVLYDANANAVTKVAESLAGDIAASYKLGDKEIRTEDQDGEQDDVENAALTGLHRNTEIVNQSLTGIYKDNLGVPANAIVKIFTTNEDAEFYCKSVALAKNLVQNDSDHSYIGSISDFAQLTNLEPGSYTIMELQAGYKYKDGVVVPETNANDDDGVGVINNDDDVTSALGAKSSSFNGNTGEWIIKPYVNKFNTLYAVTGQWWRNWRSGVANGGYYSDRKTNRTDLVQAIKQVDTSTGTFDWTTNTAAPKYNNLNSVIGVVPTLITATQAADSVYVDTDEEAWANNLASGTANDETLAEMFSASNLKGYTSSPWVKIGTFEIGNYVQTKVGNSNLLNISNEVLPCITLMKLDQNDYDTVKGTVSDDGKTTDGVYSYNVDDIEKRATTPAGYLNSADDDANYSPSTGMKFVVDNWSQYKTGSTGANTGFSSIYAYTVSDTAGNQEEHAWTPNNVYLTKFRLTSVSQAADGSWYADGVGTDVDGLEIWSNGAPGTKVYDTNDDGIADDGATIIGQKNSDGVSLLDEDGDGKADGADIASILDSGFVRIEGAHPGYYTVEELECYDATGHSVPVTNAKLTKYVGLRYTGTDTQITGAITSDTATYEKGGSFDKENIFVVENSTDEYGKYKIRKLDENGDPVKGVSFSLSKTLDYRNVDKVPNDTEYTTPYDFNSNALYKGYKNLFSRAYYDVQTTDDDGYATFVKIPYDVLVDKFGNFKTTSKVNIHLEEIDHGPTGTIPVTKLDDGTLAAWDDSAPGCQICNTRDDVQAPAGVDLSKQLALYKKVYEHATIGKDGVFTDDSLLDRGGYNDTLEKITGSGVNDTLDLTKTNTVIDTKSPKGKHFTVAKKKAINDETLLSTPMGTQVRFYVDTLDEAEDALYVYKCLEDVAATPDCVARVKGQYYLARPGSYNAVSGEFEVGTNPAENEFTADDRFKLVTEVVDGVTKPLTLNDATGVQQIYLTENWNSVSTIYVSEEDDMALAAVMSGDLEFEPNGVLKDGSGTKLNKVSSIAPRKYKVSLAYKDVKQYTINYVFSDAAVTVTDTAPTTYKVGEAFVTKQGDFNLPANKYLEGWYSDAACTKKLASMGDAPVANDAITVYGKVVDGITTAETLRVKAANSDSNEATDTVTFFNKGKVSITLHKQNSAGQIISGATFYVIPKSVYEVDAAIVDQQGKLAISDEEAKKKGIITLVTNASGSATTGDVIKRNTSYVIIEGPAPKGYLRNDGILATFTKTLDNCATSDCSFDLSDQCGYLDEDVLNTNSVVVKDGKPSIEFYKLDENGLGLNGATFVLKCTSDPKITITPVVSKRKNGKDGYVSFSDIPVADYELWETQAPDGYVKYTKVLQKVTAKELLANLKGNTTASKVYKLKDVSNTPIKGRIRVVKKSSDEAFLIKHSLAGAEFRVVTKEDWLKDGRKAKSAKDYDGKVVRDLVSNNDGSTDYTPYLAKGSYVLFETKAPDFMEINYDWSYQFDVTTSSVEVAADGTVTYNSSETTCTDKPYKTRIKVYKYDAMAQGAGKALSGAEFSLYSYDGSVGADEYTLPKSAKLVTSKLTGDDGYAEFGDLYLDGAHYCIKETRAPSGYWLGTANGESTKSKVYYLNDDYFNTDTAVTVSNQVSTINYPPTVSVGDLAKLKLRINKHTVGGKKVSGAGFTIYKVVDEDTEGAVEIAYKDGKKNADDSYSTSGSSKIGYGVPVEIRYTTTGTIPTEQTATEFFTDEDGRIDFPGYLEIGDYYVVETTTPNGYATADSVKLRIDGDTSYVLDDYGKHVVYDVTEIRVGFVKLHKVDDTGKALEGIKFELVDAEGRLLEATTDANGNCSWGYTDTDGDGVPDGIPLGDYTLRETYIPENYKGLLKVADQSFTLTEDNNTYDAPYTLNVTDIYNTSLRVYKQDTDTKVFLAGAEFTLYDGDGKVIETKVSDENGLVVFSKVLEYGKSYTVKETKAPDGYLGNDTVQTVYYEKSELDDYTQQEIDERHTLHFFNEKKRSPEFHLHKVEKDKTTSEFTSLPGAKVGLYDSDHKLIEEKVTDGDGKAIWTNLEFGTTYFYRELEAPEGYVLDSTEYTFSTSDVSGEIVERTLVNTEIERSLVIIKKDNGSEKPLAGAKFNLYDADITGMSSDEIISHTVKTGTTDANGVLSFGHLKLGVTYYYQEVEAPEGYVADEDVHEFVNQADKVINSKDTSDVVLKAGELAKQGYEVVIVGNTLRYVKFTKYDDEGNVITKNGCTIAIYDSKGDEVARDSTDESGTLTITGLKAGDYTYKEIAAPNGYKLNEKTFSFTIKESDTEVLISMEDEAIPHGGFEFTKTDVDDTSILIPNCKIVIRDADGKVVTTGTTDKNGKFVLSNLALGKYTYQEVEAPEGYEIDNTPYPFEVLEGKVTHCIMKDVKQGSFEFTKTDMSDSAKLLPGCEIVIKDSSGKEVIHGTTDAKGKFTMHLPSGKYTYQEVKAPEGYNLDTTVYSFSVSAGKVTKCVMKDVRGGDMEFTKTDVADDTKLIPDCQIVIKDSKGNEVVKGTTDKTGKIVFKNLAPGKYTYQEIKAPAGYKIDTKPYEFTVESGKITKCVMKDVLGTGGGKITKTDINTGEKIPNCGILITNEKGKEVFRGYTDKNGDVEFENFPVGTYYYSEFDAPEGWLLNEKRYSFTIKEDGEIIKCKMKDVRKKSKLGIFDVLKVDADDNTKVLKGAKFSVYDNHKKLVATKVTDSDGIAEFALPLGTYYVKEISAPKGYKVDSRMHKFKVTTEGQYLQYVMENKKTPKVTPPVTKTPPTTVRVPKTGMTFKVGAAVFGGLGTLFSILFLLSSGYFTFRKKKH